MNNIDERFEKMQESFNNLQNQFLMLRNIETPTENEGIYKISSVSEIYHQTNSEKKFINILSLQFPVYKFFIEEIEERSHKLNTQLNKKLENCILNSIETTYKSEDYVVVITGNSFHHFTSMTKLIYDKINKNKAGKISITNNEKELVHKYEFGKLNSVGENKIMASFKHSYLNALTYNGHLLENQNIILLNDEFGFDDPLTNAIIELKPKSILNLLFARRNYWIESIH